MSVSASTHNDDVARVRDACDIVDVVGSVVSLKPKGREFVCVCPFHDDHNPSMYVVPAKQLFHCFVCGAGGDVFTFVQRFHKMDFREALEHLASHGGVELRKPEKGGARDGGREAGQASRQDIYRANQAALKFFQNVLADSEAGAPSRAVIERRGISSEMVERFALGAAPEGWDGLTSRLRAKGADLRLFTQAGLLKPRQDGSAYDTFRHRLMFPIRDAAGRCVAFGARRINDEDDPKYLNSPESAVFDKSSSLFGLHEASSAIRRTKCALVTEGYTDTIACHQGGFDHAVATLGTALTQGHARVLRRLAETVVLLFDGDDAGHRAADRAVEIFFAEPIDVRIATLDRFTDAKDPDELLKRAGGAEVFARVIEGAEDLLGYRFARLAESVAGAGITGVESAAKSELERLADLGLASASPIRRELIIRKVSEITGLTAETVAASIPAGRRASPERAPAEGALPSGLRPGTALGPGDMAIGCMLVEPKCAPAPGEDTWRWLDSATYACPEVMAIARVIRIAVESGREMRLGDVLTELASGEASTAVTLHERVRRLTGDESDRVGATLADCARELERRHEAASRPRTSAAEAIERIRASRPRLGDDPRRLPRTPTL